MDSKQRHQLEQNELAKWLTTQYKDWIQPNSSWLGYAVLGVLIVVAVLIGTARVNSWNRAAAWKHYYAALQSPQAETELELVANSTSGIVGVQARLALGQRQLAEGSEMVFINKAQSIIPLEKAVDSFQRVQKGTSDPLILQQAGFGLGQSWETLAAARIGDDLTKAEEEYQKVADRWGDEFWGGQAKQQLATIRQPATQTVIKLAAAKVPVDDFNVEFDPSDPFAPGGIDLDTRFGLTPENAVPTQETVPTQATVPSPEMTPVQEAVPVPETAPEATVPEQESPATNGGATDGGGEPSGEPSGADTSN